MDFRQTTKSLFLVLYDRQIFLTINGLSFADVIFVDWFQDPFAGVSIYKVEVDQEYTMPKFLSVAKIGTIATKIN